MRRYESREARFSNRVLLNYAAANLPELLAVRAAVGDAPVEILLYDEIGFWGITAKDFVLALAQCGGAAIKLRINSPGGDVFDGLAIYNALKAHPAPVECVVDGLAASAASFIALAGSNLAMAEASMLMIHDAWGLVIGNRHDMTDTAGVLAKIDGQLAEIYAAKCGKPVVDMAAMMDAETWLTAKEAQDLGLCDLVRQSAQKVPAASARILPRAGVGAALRRLRAMPRAFDPAYPDCDPDNPDETNPNCSEFYESRRHVATALPAYDPDGDGDNDAEEAVGYLASIGALVEAAIGCLTGGEDDDDGSGESSRGAPVVPGARAAATEAEWVCGAAEDLPIDTSDSWDGHAAADRILDNAGFNSNSPDPAKAKRGFLVWDHHNPNLKGSYKLPFADLVSGELKAVKGGIDAAASRLPQTDIPADVKQKARDVLDAYESRMSKTSAHASRDRRLRLAEAEAA